MLTMRTVLLHESHGFTKTVRVRAPAPLDEGAAGCSPETREVDAQDMEQFREGQEEHMNLFDGFPFTVRNSNLPCHH
jgi:hypothetical protein